MQLQANKLIELLEPLQPVINDNHIIPVLRNVKIEIKDGFLTCSGDNTEVNVVNRLEFPVLDELSFCVNYQFLFKILKSLNKQDIELSLNNGVVFIKHKKGSFELPADNVSEFPIIKQEIYKNKATAVGSDLKSSLKVATKFTLNSDLEAFSNVSIEINESIKIRSTNKITLFVDEVDGSGDPAHILISGQSCNALQSLINDNKTEILYNDSSVFFKNDKTEVMIVQQNGNFPIDMFNKIIENGMNSSKLKVDFQDFITSIKRTSILSAKEKFSPLRLDIKDKKIEFSFDNVNSSSKANETIKGKFKRDLLVGFDHRYLLEVLSVFESDSTFKIGENNFFCIQNGNKFGVLAPTQIQE